MRGGYYIQTIIHFSNLGTNPNDAALHTRAKNIMEYINSVFNPFGIYFVAVSGCNGSPVSHDCPSTLVPYVLEDFTFFEPPVLSRCSTALDIFDMGDSGSFAGFAFREPNTYLRSGGSYNNISATLSPNLIHEIGHCLGLLHTYVGFFDNVNGTPDACGANPATCWNPAYPNVDICVCCGDNVCDTELTPYELVINSNCELVSHQNWNPPLTEHQYRNYMGGATSNVNLTSQTQLCFNRFSPGQVARMRAYLRLSTTLDSIQIKKKKYSGTLPGGIYGNIVVKSGETLEINQPIQMLPGASIRVEKGALLRINSTVRGFGCEGLWRGIIVDGDAILSQAPQNQGKVIVNYPGRIEHARIGIDVQSMDSQGNPIDGTGGGIVNVLSGKFFNCITGIRFDELEKVYATVRPHLELNGSLHQLPPTITNTLQNWADWCSEPGFLSQRLLWLNGIDVEPDCTGDGIGQRARKQKEEKQLPLSKSLKIYPNPASFEVLIESNGDFKPGIVSLYNLQGIRLLTQTLPSESKRISILTSQLATGIYLIELHFDSGLTERCKLLILR